MPPWRPWIQTLCNWHHSGVPAQCGGGCGGGYTKSDGCCAEPGRDVIEVTPKVVDVMLKVLGGCAEGVSRCAGGGGGCAEGVSRVCRRWRRLWRRGVDV